MGLHHNKDVDAAYEAARTALTREARGAHYKRLQEIWRRDCEFVPLFWYGTYFARSRRFFGWADQLDYSIPWWHWGRIRPVETA
jgi:peptide/nickel transport system substrate-binding protein